MKTFFNSKTLRERVLLTAFILIAVTWWGTSLLGRTRAFQTDWKATADDIDDQKNWLKQKDQVEGRTVKVTAQLDPARTLNATQAYAEVSRLAQGLPVEMGATRTERTESFAMHSFPVTFRRIELKPLRDFYVELSKKAPYLGIDQSTISIDRAVPGQVNAVFRVYSVEVLAPSAP